MKFICAIIQKCTLRACNFKQLWKTELLKLNTKQTLNKAKNHAFPREKASKNLPDSDQLYVDFISLREQTNTTATIVLRYGKQVHIVM